MYREFIYKYKYFILIIQKICKYYVNLHANITEKVVYNLIFKVYFYLLK
jgi:hypothetical protein